MSKPLILMYHRIANEPIDYWGLAVSPANFDEQLSVLRRTRHPLPLADFVRDLVAGTLHPAAVALTFDDGYVDNLVDGLPRLAVADVPATVFLATGYLDRLEPFWWDELAEFVLLEAGPKSFEIMMHGQPKRFELGAESTLRAEDAKAVPGSKSRRDVLEAIYRAIRCLDEEERRATIVQLRSIFGGHDDRATLGRAMTGDEVRTLVADGLVTIGAHTVTHPALPELDAAACGRELSDSKLACEAIIGAPVTDFAYPFGELNADVREAAKTAGFVSACSTQRGPAVATSDVFALPRLYIPDLDGDAFEQRIRWASAGA
jgi:peptidoglycan/xylan/chitin deacetylase (PgdA/CDA1 family)